MAAVALFVLEDEPLRGPINEGRLKATHRAIFEEIYDWAGMYRENVGTMTKGRAVGTKLPTEVRSTFHLRCNVSFENWSRGLSAGA